MVAYMLNDEIEKRLKEWAKKKYKDDAGRIAMGRSTFSDIISDLLAEVGC